MAKNKQQLKKELDNIEKKLNDVIKKVGLTRKKLKSLQNQDNLEKDEKEIVRLKNKIASL